MRIWDGFRKAFKITEGEELFPEEKELLLELAEKIKKKGLVTPAILFIESARPLNFLASQALLFIEPFLNSFSSGDKVRKIRSALEKRKSLSFLLEQLEKTENKKI